MALAAAGAILRGLERPAWAFSLLGGLRSGVDARVVRIHYPSPFAESPPAASPASETCLALVVFNRQARCVQVCFAPEADVPAVFSPDLAMSAPDIAMDSLATGLYKQFLAAQGVSPGAVCFSNYTPAGAFYDPENRTQTSWPPMWRFASLAYDGTRYVIAPDDDPTVWSRHVPRRIRQIPFLTPERTIHLS